MSSEKPKKVRLTFKLDFKREGVLCCNCYIMRVSLTSCHILAVFFYLLDQGKVTSPLKQMEKICLSASCGNLISPNSCLTLHKHEVRESPISNQSCRLTFPANCARWADLEGVVEEHHHHRARGDEGLMCSCLCPLMPFPIRCTAESCDLSHRKSADTCRRKLYFNTIPLRAANVFECMCDDDDDDGGGPVCYYSILLFLRF